MSDNQDNQPPAKKPKKQASLAAWLKPSIVVNKKTGRAEIKEVEPVPPGPSLIGDKHKCANCDRTFLSPQALGNHYNYCAATKARKADAEKKLAAKTTEVFAMGPGKKKPGKEYHATPAEQRATINLDVEPKEDKRKGNRGSAHRQRHTNEVKWEHLEKLEIWQDEQKKNNSPATIAAYCREFHPNDQTKWANFLVKWTKSKDQIAKAVSDEKYGRLKTIARGKQGKTPYKEMEDELYNSILNDRKNKRKVSRLSVQVRARKIVNEHDKKNNTNKGKDFKASNGWFWNFLRRKNIKFRARKSGKKKSTDENLPKILQWYGYMRHKVLTRYTGDPEGQHWTTKFGRFPPKLRYNVDQVPLPFVVSMDSTYTTADDEDVQIAGTGKGDHRKRQFTMNIYVNAGEGEDADGYVELICKGKVIDGSRFSKIEREAWAKDVPMYFQQNAWMDREVMALSAQNFSEHVKEKWGDQKVLLFCDNLDAHVCDNTKKIFADGNVFLFCLPPSVTEAVQAIDAGYGRSMRCAVGRLLNSWLMEEKNMEMWETEKGMTAAQRRILVSNLVSAANKEILKNDELRIGCFERTGMLLTLDGSDDDKIRPQGLSKKFLPIKVPTLVDLSKEPASPAVVVTAQQQAEGWTGEDEALHEGDTDIGDKDVVVDEVIDGDVAEDEVSAEQRGDIW